MSAREGEMNPFQSSCSASCLGLSLGNHYSLFLLTPASTPHLAGGRHSDCSGGLEVWQHLVKICSICISYSELGPAASGVLGDWHHGTQTRQCSPEIIAWVLHWASSGLLELGLHRYGRGSGLQRGWVEELHCKPTLYTCFLWSPCVSSPSQHL